MQLWSCFLPLLQLSAELFQDFTRLPVVLYSRLDQCRQLAHLLHLLATYTSKHTHKLSLKQSDKTPNKQSGTLYFVLFSYDNVKKNINKKIHYKKQLKHHVKILFCICWMSVQLKISLSQSLRNAYNNLHMSYRSTTDNLFKCTNLRLNIQTWRKFLLHSFTSL